jgi:hypothetical protein
LIEAPADATADAYATGPTAGAGPLFPHPTVPPVERLEDTCRRSDRGFASEIL